MFFKKIKIHCIQYPIYELDCTKHDGIFCCTREQWLTNKLIVKKIDLKSFLK